MTKKLIFLLIVLSMVGGSLWSAADVPTNIQVKLILKIISMDRNLDRYGDPVKIGVTSDALVTALNAEKAVTIKGKAFAVEKMGSPDDVAKYKVVWIGKDWAGKYSAVSDKANANQCLVFCESEEGVLNGGGAVSFKVVESSPKIVLNIENAKKQGTDFPADFLKITVVVGGLN